MYFSEIIYFIMSALLVLIMCVVIHIYRKLFHRKKRTVFQEINILIENNIISKDYYEGINKTNICLKSQEGYELNGYLVNCENAIHTIVLSHGISCNHAYMLGHVQFFIKKKFNVLIIDQRGHGYSSKAKPTYGFLEAKDICLWIEYLHKHGYNKVGILGHSMGASIALLSCNEEVKPDFVIAESAFSNLYELTKYQLKLKKLPVSLFVTLTSALCRVLNGFWLSDIDVLEVIKNSPIPMLFIHGEGDNLIPSFMSEYMAKETNSKVFIARGCGHHVFRDIKNSFSDYENVVDDFLKPFIK